MENIFVEFLPPWVETGLQPAFYDKESGTVLQQTARMYARVNMLIRMFNKLSKNTKTTVEDYVNRFNELYTYVHDYFDNLDVQEEINHKLDEMIEDGSLQEIVDSYLDSLTEKVEYIFPKNWDAFSGDTNLIKGYGKTILIDNFIASNKADLYDMLSEYNVTHIDYMILTHYHADHVGNTISLITDGYIDSDSYVYIPPDCQQIIDSPALTATKNEILLALTQNNIPYSIPAENSVLSIDQNFNIEFYNTDFQALSDYTNYNNCSTMCKANHNGKIVLYTGDAIGHAINRALNNGFIDSHVDLYKIEHHGIEYSNASIEMLNTILPDYAYLPGFIRDFEKNNYSSSTSMAFLQENGCNIYASFANKNYIVFQSFNGTLDIIQGVQTPSLSNNNYVGNPVRVLHVDANTANTIQDGSSSYPFKDLPQALGWVEKTNVGRFSIRLNDGHYCVQHESVDKNNPLCNDVDIVLEKEPSATVENVVIEGQLSFFNSKLTIKYVTFQNKSDVTTNLIVNDCDVEIDHVAFDGTNATTTGIWSKNSHLNVHDSSFANDNVGISLHNDTIKFNTNTLTDCVNGVINRDSISIRNGNTYTDVTQNFGIDNGFDSGLIQVYGGSATSGEVTLYTDIRQFNKIIVISGALGSGTLYTDTIMSFYPSNFAANSTYKVRTVDGMLSLAINANGTKLTITPSNTSVQLRKIYGVKVSTN